MTSFLMKIFICPIAVILSDWLFPNVNFDTYGQAIIVGLILAVVGTIMEYLFLKRGTLWISTFLDFVATLAIVYLVSNLFEGTEVTLWGALLVAFILGVVEFVTHSWLIDSGRTQKT